MQNLHFFEIFFLNFFLFRASYQGFTGYDEQAWLDAAAFLKEGYNPSGDACKNFTDFACGSWFKKDHDDSEINQFQLQLKYVLKYIKDAVDEIDKNDHDTPPYKIWVKQFYEACKQNSTTHSEMVRELYDELADILGTPPFYGSDPKSKYLLEKNPWYLLGFIQSQFPSASPFIKLTIQPATLFENIKMAVLYFLPNIQNIEPIDRDRIKKSLLEVAESKNISINKENLDKEIDAMVKFEEMLSNDFNDSSLASLFSEITDFVTDNRLNGVEQKDNLYSVVELKEKFSNASWSDYFEGLFTKQQHARLNESFTGVLIEDTNMMEKLVNTINATLEVTNINTLFNYVFYKIFRMSLDDITSTDPIWKSIDKCSNTLRENFRSAMARMIFDHLKLDPLEWRSDLELMKETVFSAARFFIAGSSLDDDDKMKLITKINQITFFSGIPDWILNDTEIERRTIRYDPELTMVQNLLLIQKGNLQRNLDYVIDILYVNVDGEPVLDQNANYGSLHINMYLGYCFLPWYNPKYPLAVKYGNVGWVIGHELMHAFDTSNVELPAKYLKSWLNEFTMKAYQGKVDCLVKQYSSFCSKTQNLCLSGTTTVAENMADIDGLKVAYMAYKFATATAGKDNPLPGLTELSDDKIFFLTYGRSVCATNGDVEKWFKTVDVHSPLNARMNFPIRNFDKFSVVFQCPTGSVFNPSGSCSIWGEYKDDVVTNVRRKFIVH